MNATVKYGLIAGIISSIILVGLHYVNFEMSQSYSVQLVVGFLFPIIFMVLAVKDDRAKQEGFISFGEALKTSFIVFMIAAIISSAAQFAHYQTFSDDTWTQIADIQKENVKGMMEMVGADELEMDEALNEGLTVEVLKESMSGIGAFMMNLLGNIFIGLIVSLIVSAIMKRNPTP